jgi:hypothetical protein
MSAESKIGFHAARNRVTGKETGSGNPLIGAYLNKLGLAYPAMRCSTSLKPPPCDRSYAASCHAVDAAQDYYCRSDGSRRCQPRSRVGLCDGMPSENAARSAAAEMCRTASAGDTDARAHCEVVVIFHNKCVASAVDPKARTPGAGWGVSSSQREADSQALEQCRATAGYDRAEFCVVTDRHCDGSGK